MISTFGDAFEVDPKVQIAKNTEVPFVEMADIEPWNRTAHAKGRKKFSGGSKFLDGDVLVARITPSLENGKTSIYKADQLDKNTPAGGSTEFIIVRGIPGKSISEFAYYLLRTADLRAHLIANMNGSSGRQRVQAGALRNYVVDLPSIEEQQRIADMLGALDDKIESNRRIAVKCDEVANILFHQAATVNRKLDAVSEVRMGVSPPGSSYNETGDGIAFFQGVRDFSLLHPVARVYTNQPKRLAAAGDILFSVRAPVGRLNIADSPCCIGRGLAAITSNRSATCLFALRAAAAEWEKFSAEGTVFGAVNQKSLKSTLIPWPDPVAEEELEYQLSSLVTLASHSERESISLSKLRDALLPELMSGRMRVDEAGRLVSEALNEEIY
jgi:restriction modification system DNA specificity subunit